MKKLLMVLLLFIALVYAGLIDYGPILLGGMYYHGLGVRQNYKEALKWYRKAADQGDAKAQYDLGVGYENGLGVRQNKSKAKELFGQSCDNGYQKGCNAYKILNEEGVQ